MTPYELALCERLGLVKDGVLTPEGKALANQTKRRLQSNLELLRARWPGDEWLKLQAYIRGDSTVWPNN